jgi:bile acid:Na+ symporter, BASS family
LRGALTNSLLLVPGISPRRSGWSYRGIQILIMRAAIQDVFRWLLLILIPLVSFTTGLKASHPGGKRLWRRPKELIRGLLAVMILVPLWVLLLVEVMPLPMVVRAGMLIAVLAVGIGPVAGMKRMSKGLYASDALDLNLVVLILAIVFVPLAFALFAAIMGRALRLGYWPVAKVILGRALVPLLIGVGVARVAPRFAERTGPRLARILDGSLLVLVVIALAATWRDLSAVGGIGWIACVLAALGSVVIGHLAGGPEPEMRAVDAVAATMRFPALALVLAAAVPRGHLLIPVVVAYVVASLLAVAAYGLVMGRRAKRRPRLVTSPGAGARRSPA